MIGSARRVYCNKGGNMDSQTVAIIGGIMGAAIGIGGGLFGTYKSIKNTETPRERQFIIRLAAGLWLVLCVWMGVPLVLVLMKVLPLEIFWGVLLPFYILLGPFIRWGNQKQAAIRAADLQDPPQPRE